MSHSKYIQRNLTEEDKILEVPDLSVAKREDDFIELHFEDGSEGKLAFPWLRDNCRCPACYDFVALCRIFELDQLEPNLSPQKVWIEDGLLNIVWNSRDDHHSVYEKEWLYIRGFISRGKEIYENFRQLKKESWGNNIELEAFNYEELLENDEALLNFLLTVERKGIALLKNAPGTDGAGVTLINRIGHIRVTQFGNSRAVKVKENHSYIAYTTSKLGLHTDLSHCEDSPGIIFVHAVKQHDGKGADSTLTDGFHCAQLMKQHHPEAFELLSSIDLYFWDKYNAAYHSNEKRFKINKSPIFRLNGEGEIEQITFNNQKRDTNLELGEELLKPFYEAFKIFLNVIYDNIHTYKLETGDIMAIDNMRCLHGREAYGWPSDRHLEVSFLDWDEARSRRRLLQEKVYGFQIYK